MAAALAFTFMLTVSSSSVYMPGAPNVRLASLNVVNTFWNFVRNVPN